MAHTVSPPRPTVAERAARAIEYRDIHLAACRYRRQALVCSTCSDVVERAERAARAAGVETVPEPVEQLVIGDGLISWSRAA